MGDDPKGWDDGIPSLGDSPEVWAEKMRRATPHARNLEAHLAIGNYVTSFSMLMALMRSLMLLRLSGPDRELSLFAVALGTYPSADPIVRGFFGMCAQQLRLDGVPLDADEKKIVKRLRRDVDKTLAERNKLAHADWILANADNHAIRSLLIRPDDEKGPLQQKEWDVSEITRGTETIRELAGVVTAYGDVAIGELRGYEPPYRISDLLVFKDDKVVREGPLADEIDQVDPQGHEPDPNMSS